MKIVHTSDWHLGKKIKNKERLDEQAKALSSLISYCDTENVDLVLIAGDVFDVYSPSADAERLFYDTVKSLAQGKRAVVCISGNHDDPSRVTAARVLAEEFGVYFDGLNDYKPRVLERIKLLSSGENHFIFEDNLGEKVFINALSYPSETRLKEAVNEEETYLEKVTRWLNLGSSYNLENLPEIVVSHLFMLGGKVGTSEKSIDLGGVRMVNNTALPINTVYVALGHLHKRQVVSNDKNAIYSGSLLQYSFDEPENQSFTSFNLQNGKIADITSVLFSGGRKLKTVEAFDFNGALQALNAISDDYVKLILHVETLTQEQNYYLSSNYKNLVELEIVNDNDLSYVSTSDRRKLNDKELFTEFHKHLYGSEPSENLLNLFLTMLEKENEL